MTQIIALRRQLAGWFGSLQNTEYRELTIVLRVDGSLGTFGKPGLENIVSKDGTICCDLVIADANWGSLTDTQIYDILTQNVEMAIQYCLTAFGVEYCDESLKRATANAG